MQLRHYEVIAATLAELRPEEPPATAEPEIKAAYRVTSRIWGQTVRAFCRSLARESPNFNGERFVKACQEL